KTAIDIRTKVDGGESEHVAELESMLGTLLQRQQHYSDAEVVLLEALATANNRGRNDQASRISEQLGNLYTAMNSFDKAQGMFKFAQQMRSTLWARKPD